MKNKLSERSDMVSPIKPEIPDTTLTQWQGIVDLMADVCSVPAALIMKVHTSEIEVLISAKVPGNPYHTGEKAALNTGLYCETVMSKRERLFVPNALKDPKWDHNPDIPLGMICYLGYPLQWPDGEIFGTICILDNEENIFSEQMDNYVRLFRGNIENYLALLFETNQRKKAEDDLRSNLSRFKTVISSLYGAVLLVTNDGVVEFANQAFCDLFLLKDCPGELIGLAASEMIGKIASSYANPEEALARIEEIVAGNRPVKGEEIALVDGRTCMRDFIPIVVEGKPYGRFWHHSDITERKRSEVALSESEERFRLAIATSPDAICITRLKDGLFVEINDAFTKMSGYTRKDISDKTSSYINIWKNPEDRERIVGVLKEKGFCSNHEAVFQRKDGTLFSGSISASVMSHKGDTHIISMTRDITDQLQAEQEKQALQAQLFQSQKMEALGTLVGGIAHDFNNMLQVVIGYSDLILSDKAKSEPCTNELKTIIETAKGGADLVTKLLAFGQQAPTFPVNMDLNHQISQLSSLISRTLPQVVLLDVDLCEGPTMIRADPNQIDQMLMNLAINASEAMPDGGRLKISTRTVSFNGEHCRSCNGVKRGNYVTLSVMDTGLGMDKETLSRIFEPFFSTKQRGSTRGTGLGLSVVQGIVQQNGGHMTCESAPGKGTEFTIYFPAIEEPLADMKSGAPPVQSGVSGTVLVVEDSIPVADLERRFLASAGYTVIVANNGREALDIYRSRREEISLVVLDLLMPEMSGRDCLMELVKIDPSVKVIIASGYATEDELHKEIRPLVRGFLQKPFARTELLESVSFGLDGDPS
jgi:PAS domain S-box-containing protein